MTFLESLRVALEALAANKMRSVLTMLGIIIGVGSVVTIFAIGRGTSAAVAGELAGLGSGQIVLQPGRPGPTTPIQRIEPFTETDMKDLERLLPDVSAALTAQSTSAPVRYGRESTIGALQGHSARAADVFDMKVAQGRWFSQTEEDSATRVVVLGDGAAKKLMGDNARPLGQTVTINGYPFRVIGVTDKPKGLLAGALSADDSNFYVPITWLRRMMGNPPIFQVILKAKKRANTKQLVEDAVALLRLNHKGAEFSGQSFDQIVSVITKVLAIVTGVLSAVAGISLVVGGVGIMNIMLVSVTERTREIGIRKAIGASYQDILSQFLIEAVMLSVFGGALGVVLATLPIWVVGSWLHISLLLDWLSVTLALSFSVAVGVIFGVFPASKAARLDPIEALRYE